MSSIVEKKKTGEFFAAKIVSNTRLNGRLYFTSIMGMLNFDCGIGKRDKILEACDAVLGEQADSQAEREK